MKSKIENKVHHRDNEEMNVPGPVKLKPLFSLPPGVWLSCLYFSIILFIFFILFLLPGIRNSGTLMTITSDPPGSAVWLDGNYLGATPGAFFIKRGEHDILLKHPYFDEERKSITVKGKLFASRFFQRKEELLFSLDRRDESFVPLFSELSKEFANWSIPGFEENGIQSSYRIPSLLTWGAHEVFSSKAPTTEEDVLLFKSLLIGTVPHINSRYQLGDMIRATSITFAEGRVPTLSSIAEMSRYLVGEMTKENRRSREWLETILPPRYTLPEWQDSATVPIQVYFPAGVPEVILEGIRFVPVRDENSSLLYVQKYEVTNGEFKSFTDSVESWKPSQREELLKEGVVNEDYLATWDWDAPRPGSEEFPVAQISWLAANAYAKWLEERSGGLWEIRLPTGQEWSGIAVGSVNSLRFESPLLIERVYTPNPAPVTSQAPGSLGVAGLWGSLWEYCGNEYAINASFFPDISSPFPSELREVRGGSWVNVNLNSLRQDLARELLYNLYQNRPESVEIDDIGSQFMNEGNQFTGFRVVAKRKS